MDITKALFHKALLETIKKQGLNSQIDFKCGDCIGPFSIKNDERALKIKISNFTGEPMSLEMEENEVTRRIQSTPSPLLANCVLMQTGELFQIVFTKDVMSMEPLRAILVADMNYRLEQQKKETNRKHECPKCHMAKFNTVQNLKIHEELYCTMKNIETSEMDRNTFEMPQNLILLPMAYHDSLQHNAVQILGPVHSVIPVALGRKSTLINTNSLHIHNRTQLDMPTSLNISHSKISINIPIIDLDEKVPSTSAALDLSSSSRAASIQSFSPSCSPTSKSPNSEPYYPDRPFSCTCGVSFSSQTTFDAHRQLYCSHTTRDSSSRGGPNRNDASRKVPDKCGKCDFVPTSSSQLSMHIRSSHQATKTFTCLVCGYRAFSMRGVRTHMRSHSNEDAQRFKANDSDDL